MMLARLARPVCRTVSHMQFPPDRNVIGRNTANLKIWGASISARNVFNLFELCKKNEKQVMDPKCAIAIVTGGSTGIGLAAAEQLLSEGVAHVVIGGRSEKNGENAVKKLNNEFGTDKAIFIRTDVTCKTEFENLFKETVARYDRVDILFNNAGILDEKCWENCIDTNIKGVLRGCLLAFKYMGKDRCGQGGVVVNNASIYGFQAVPPAPCYCCTKHAVLAITKSLGDQFHHKKNGIRMCSLCPGVTITDLVMNTEKRGFNEEWGAAAKKGLDALPIQGLPEVGKAFVYVVKFGQHAKHYIIENSKVLLADVPDRKTFSLYLASMN